MRFPASLCLLWASFLLGGLRGALAGALGAAGLALIAARSAPLSLGTAAWWLPFLGWAGLSTALSVQPWAGLPLLARWGGVLLFAALARSWDERARRAWLTGLCILGAVLGVAAFATGARHHFAHEMTGLLPPYYNYTAFVLAAAAVAAMSWALHEESPRGARRGGLFVLAAALIGCLVLAKSRGGLLGLGAGLLSSVVRRWGWRGLTGAAAAAALAATLAPAALTKAGRLNSGARPEIWRAAVGIAGEAPWLGAGPGNFLHAFRRHPVETPDGAARWGLATPYAHSEPLQIAAETGWPGLLLALLGLGMLLRRPPGAPRDAPAAAAGAVLAAMGVQLLVDNLSQITALSWLFVSALAARRGPESDGGPALPRAASLALLAGALACALPEAWARPAPADADPEWRLEAAVRAARLFPADADRREDLAYAEQSADAPARALFQWEEAERLSPFNAIYPWQRGLALAVAGRTREAEAAFARALTLEPGFHSARLRRALCLAKLGRRAEARAEIAEAKRRFAVPGPIPLSGYERALTAFDPVEAAAVEAALVGRGPKR